MQRAGADGVMGFAAAYGLWSVSAGPADMSAAPYPMPRGRSVGGAAEPASVRQHSPQPIRTEGRA
jgi:hypothetical protein